MTSFLLHALERERENPMSADKRQVATDALKTLGTIIDETAKRDAIHLAVEPVIAGHLASTRRRYRISRRAIPRQESSAGANNPVGIVDPFLETTVFTGQHFWLVVYRRQQSRALRHVWTHPGFPERSSRVGAVAAVPNSADRAASEAWLRNFIATADCPDYDTVMAAASNRDTDAVSENYGHLWTDESLQLRRPGRR